MRRVLLLFLISMSVLTASSVTLSENSLSAVDRRAEANKQEVDEFIQTLARIKLNEIDYAYISFSMIKQLLSSAVDGDLEDAIPIVGSIKSLRRFSTTGSRGYYKLKSALKPFLQEDDNIMGRDNIMGMELMALSKEDGATLLIYSNSDRILVITDDGDEELVVVYIVGLSYNSLLQLKSEGVDIDLGF